MRLRNVKGSREAMTADPYVITDDIAGEYKGKWKDAFGADRPIRLEIGMGKGRFLMELAEAHPDISYIGIEKYSSVLVRAAQKLEQRVAEARKTEADFDPNVRFIRMDAEYICNVFAPAEVERIYLNFSDPWPKDRHAKRRLTSRQFLARYEQILAPGGEVIFKTDNRGLFDFSLEEVKASSFELVDVTYDLHANGNPEGNVMTEYEARFVELGDPICRMILKMK